MTAVTVVTIVVVILVSNWLCGFNKRAMEPKEENFSGENCMKCMTLFKKISTEDDLSHMEEQFQMVHDLWKHKVQYFIVKTEVDNVPDFMCINNHKMLYT